MLGQGNRRSFGTPSTNSTFSQHNHQSIQGAAPVVSIPPVTPGSAPVPPLQIGIAADGTSRHFSIPGKGNRAEANLGQWPPNSYRLKGAAAHISPSTGEVKYSPNHEEGSSGSFFIKSRHSADKETWDALHGQIHQLVQQEVTLRSELVEVNQALVEQQSLRSRDAEEATAARQALEDVTQEFTKMLRRERLQVKDLLSSSELHSAKEALYSSELAEEAVNRLSEERASELAALAELASELESARALAKQRGTISNKEDLAFTGADPQRADSADVAGGASVREQNSVRELMLQVGPLWEKPCPEETWLRAELQEKTLQYAKLETHLADAKTAQYMESAAATAAKEQCKSVLRFAENSGSTANTLKEELCILREDSRCKLELMREELHDLTAEVNVCKDSEINSLKSEMTKVLMNSMLDRAVLSAELKKLQSFSAELENQQGLLHGELVEAGKVRQRLKSNLETELLKEQDMVKCTREELQSAKEELNACSTSAQVASEQQGNLLQQLLAEAHAVCHREATEASVKQEELRKELMDAKMSGRREAAEAAAHAVHHEQLQGQLEEASEYQHQLVQALGECADEHNEARGKADGDVSHAVYVSENCRAELAATQALCMALRAEATTELEAAVHFRNEALQASGAAPGRRPPGTRDVRGMPDRRPAPEGIARSSRHTLSSGAAQESLGRGSRVTTSPGRAVSPARPTSSARAASQGRQEKGSPTRDTTGQDRQGTEPAARRRVGSPNAEKKPSSAAAGSPVQEKRPAPSPATVGRSARYSTPGRGTPQGPGSPAPNQARTPINRLTEQPVHVQTSGRKGRQNASSSARA